MGIIDSQSVKTLNAADERGFDGNKKVKGRKRHIIVDSLGHLLTVKVHGANHHDSPSSIAVIDAVMGQYDCLKAICGDGGYNGSSTLHAIKQYGIDMIISKKIKAPEVSPKRWIVERTFAWLGWYRRVAIDYEKLISFSENMVRIAMIALGIRRLRKP